jgi:hypothetical protein
MFIERSIMPDRSEKLFQQSRQRFLRPERSLTFTQIVLI